MERPLEDLRAQVGIGDSELCVIAADFDHFKWIDDAAETTLLGRVALPPAPQLPSRRPKAPATRNTPPILARCTLPSA